MKLKDYIDKRRVTTRRVEEEIALLFGSGPKHTTLYAIATGVAEPKLELALMICRWSKGEVGLHDLIVDVKRRYTTTGSAIFEPQKRSFFEEVKETEETDSIEQMMS